MVDVGPIKVDLVLAAAAGWCAPSDAVLDLFDPLRVRTWPAGLTEDDLDWLARMLVMAELDPEPYWLEYDTTPLMSVRRGGARFPG